MSQFLRPKFRFGLYIVDNNKANFSRFQNNNANQPVICHADSYEIKEDGSIVFYQAIKSQDDKRFKVPVLSYPHGKWEACVLLDDNNEFPVFKGYTNIVSHEPIVMPTMQTHDNGASISNSVNSEPNFENIKEVNNSSDNSSIYSEMDQLDEMFGTTTPKPPLSTQNTNHMQSTPASNYQYNQSVAVPMQLPGSGTGFASDHSHLSPVQGGYSVTHNQGMPGVHNPNNPQEFKKQKEEWLSNEIKKYIKDVNLFNVSEFLSYISKQAQNKTYRISESDAVWAASRLIREKSVMNRKFAEPILQKTLALLLPDIMKRQWSGKMGPILQTLQDREETKNATAIDVAVWMVQNNFD